MTFRSASWMFAVATLPLLCWAQPVNPPRETPPPAEKNNEGASTQAPSQKPSDEAEFGTLQPPTAAKNSAGNSGFSLFFTPNQVRAMLDALTSYETNPHDAASHQNTIPSDGPITIEKQKIPEPDTYPVFYLTSIVYHASNDWSLWISGHKITSKHNPTSLKVTAISPDRATFTWVPPYNEALAKRQEDHLFANEDAVKNKRTETSNFTYDKARGVVTFTLRPNQSFVVAYLDTFEGFIESPALEPLDPDKKANKDGAAQNTFEEPATDDASPTIEIDRKPKGVLDDGIGAVQKHL